MSSDRTPHFNIREKFFWGNYITFCLSVSIFLFLFLLSIIIYPDYVRNNGYKGGFYYPYFILGVLGVTVLWVSLLSHETAVSGEKIIVKVYRGNKLINTLEYKIDQIKCVKGLSKPETPRFAILINDGKVLIEFKKTVVDFDSLKNLLISREVDDEVFETIHKLVKNVKSIKSLP